MLERLQKMQFWHSIVILVCMNHEAMSEMFPFNSQSEPRKKKEKNKREIFHIPEKYFSEHLLFNHSLILKELLVL